MLLKRIVMLTSLTLGSLAGINTAEASDWLTLGRKSVAEQQFGLAVLFLTNELKENPSNVEAYLERAKAFKMQGDFVQSAEDMKKAYDLDPTYIKRLKGIDQIHTGDKSADKNVDVSSNEEEQ